MFCTSNFDSLEPERIMARPGSDCNLTMDSTTDIPEGIDSMRITRRGHVPRSTDCTLDRTDRNYGWTMNTTLLLEARNFDQAIEWADPYADLYPDPCP